MTIRHGTLEVGFAEGMSGPEWGQLLEAILQDLPVVRRVRFLLPGGPEASHVQPLDDLIRVLTARGVDVERRDVGPPRSTDPPSPPAT